MEVELTAASLDDHPIIQNLARFYVYDLSEYAGWPCPDDGLYECRDLSIYWRTLGAQFLLKVDSELAGFALVDRNPTPKHDYWMGEFFVLRKFRRRGVGSMAARLVLERLRGSWMIGQMPNNRPAIGFWRKVIIGHMGDQFSESVGRVAHVARGHERLRVSKLGESRRHPSQRRHYFPQLLRGTVTTMTSRLGWRLA